MIKQDTKLPGFFQELIDEKRICTDAVLSAGDGFYMLTESLSAMLASAGIESFPDREGRIMECKNFFDDWFLFAVPDGSEYVYGLLKMREQEDELERGIQADGDTPGVTVSFIEFDTAVLAACLENPAEDNRQKLGVEINRTVAYPKQAHHAAMKEYFIRPQAEAPYLIAETYIKHIAGFSAEGRLSVPKAYAEIYGKRASSSRYARIPDFLERNNEAAAALVCDHENIYIRDTEHLTAQEKLAILATHTGNVSVHSFAAEIRYHAMFLTKLAKLPLPLAGSPYASAVRADMSIGDKEFQGPTPYYDLSGKMIREQMKYHGDV